MAKQVFRPALRRPVALGHRLLQAKTSLEVVSNRMQSEVHPVTPEPSVSDTSVAGVLHPCKRMLYDCTNPGDKSIVPPLLNCQFLLAANTVFSYSAEDTSLSQPLFALNVHVRTVRPDAVMFISDQIVDMS